MSDSSKSGVWKTLVTFTWIQQALMVRTQLEADGIEVLIPEEHMSTINPIYTAMQVRVQVRESDLSRAQEILESSAAFASEAEIENEYKLGNELPGVGGSTDGAPEWTCRSCGAHATKRVPQERNILIAIFGALFGAPMRGAEKTICASCERRV